jgi:hypothetical protein
MYKVDLVHASRPVYHNQPSGFGWTRGFALARGLVRGLIRYPSNPPSKIQVHYQISKHFILSSLSSEMVD